MCRPVPYIHYISFLAHLAGPRYTIFPFLRYHITISQPVPHVLGLSIFSNSPVGTVSTALPFVGLDQICTSCIFFAHLAGLRCTILAFFGLYHIYITSIFCHPWPVPHLPYYQCLACTIFASIRYFFNAWPVRYMQHSHFPHLPYYQCPACTIFASIRYFFNAWPVLYMQHSHLLAHTIFTLLQIFVTPGRSHIYPITNAWPVPYLLQSGIFFMPGQYCICSTPICRPVPYLHHFNFLSLPASPTCMVFPMPGVTHQTCLVLWTWRKLADETNAKNAPKIC